MGRHSKLDDDRLRVIIKSLNLAMSEKDAAIAAGICERTYFNWKARARAAAEVLPEDWSSLKFDELIAVAEELDIDLSKTARSGRGNRLTREDLIRVIRSRAAIYVEFLRQIDSAAPSAKRAILERLDDLIQGRVKVRKTRTVQTVRIIDQDGSTVPVPNTNAVVITDVLELPPNRQAAIKMLEMRWPEEFGPRAGAGRGKDGVLNPDAAAREVHDAIHRMLSTIPGPQKMLTDGGTGTEEDVMDVEAL